MSDLSNANACAVAASTPAQNRWAIVAVMLAVALATLDTAIANTALPAIAADLCGRRYRIYQRSCGPR